jgi:hypothetical protein
MNDEIGDWVENLRLDIAGTEHKTSYFDARIVLHCFGSIYSATTGALSRVFCGLIHKYLNTEGDHWNIISTNVYSIFMQLLFRL